MIMSGYENVNTKTFFYHGINWLEADIDPDQYLQIPSQCAVEGQKQDSMEVCGCQIQHTQSCVFICSYQGWEQL